MKIKMIALDLDGTVLTDNKEVTPYTKEVLENAIADGVIVLPCTGRPANAIPKAVMEIKGVKYAISSNGARIVDLDENKVLGGGLISTEEILKLIEIVKKYDTYREVFWDGTGRAEKGQYKLVSKYLSEYMAGYIRDTRIFVDDLEDYALQVNKDCDKLHIAFADMDERKCAIEDVKQLGGYEFEAAMPQSIEITAPGISKGAGIIMLGEMLGIKREEIMCVGDGMNDASMLREVGIPVAMGNAVPEIKKLATYITATNNENGVAKAVKYFLEK